MPYPGPALLRPRSERENARTPLAGVTSGSVVTTFNVYLMADRVEFHTPHGSKQKQLALTLRERATSTFYLDLGTWGFLPQEEGK